MRYSILLIAPLLFLANLSFSQSVKEKFPDVFEKVKQIEATEDSHSITLENGKVVFHIRFDCCWENDTVTLFLNNKEVFVNEILNNPSDPFFGWSITGVNAVLIENKRLHVKLAETQYFTDRFDINKREELSINVKVNDKTHQKTANLKDGKYFVIDQFENEDLVISQYMDQPPIH